MKTLILYSSCDGQTKKIAEFIQAELGQEIAVAMPLTADSVLVDEFEQIIIGASVRYGHFNRTLYQFIEKNNHTLSVKRTAFFGVNLTARKQGKNMPETNVYVRKFLSRIKWRPTQSAVFAGALFYPRYGFFDRIMIRFIMKLTGGETDVSKEVEYTDWENVRKFVNLLRDQ